MRSEPTQVLSASTCKCGMRPVHFFYDDPSGVVFHRVYCPCCWKKITSLSKFRAINRWNEYIKGDMPI